LRPVRFAPFSAPQQELPGPSRFLIAETATHSYAPQIRPDSKADSSPVVLHEADTLDGGDLLPGFEYSLSRLFNFEV
jgi:hypothetical protein